MVKIAEFGAFVELNANTDGMVHVSEIAPFRIDRVESVLKVGDKVPFDQVLLSDNGKDATTVGMPFIKGAKVEATIQKIARAKKNA